MRKQTLAGQGVATFFGGMTLLMLVGVPVVLVMLLLNSLASSVSDTLVGWRSSTAEIVESREQTKRVEIIADGAVKMNDRNAKAQERTSGWWLMHRMWTSFQWSLGILAVLFVVYKLIPGGRA